MATKIKGLQQWCRRITDGYRDVNITDFTTSWRDGLAFCAMIHRFRPDLIDYDSLSKENVYENNHMAFTVAEKELDIPAFLEAADMVALRTPDKLSIITYVSQYYNKLNTLPQLGGPGVREKTAPSASAASAGTKRHQKAEPLSEPEPKKQPTAKDVGGGGGGDMKTKGKSLGDKCAICNNKVYLLERHIEDGKLFHRSCYRHSDLSPTNKVYTRSPFLSPSLHGKDAGSTPTTKSQQSFPSGAEKTGEEKHGVKRPSEDPKRDEKSKKSDIQKSLFSDSSRSGGKFSDQNKEDAKKADTWKDKQRPSDLKMPSTLVTSDSAQADKKLSPTPKFDARAFEKHSLDFLSAEKEAKDVKSPKRQLPLIFQAAEKSDDKSAVDKTKNGPVTKTSVFSKDKPSSNQSSVLFGAKTENQAKSFLPGNRTGGESKTSAFTGSKTDNTKSGSDSKISEKTAGPVAKPRQNVKKVVEEKMDTSEPVQTRSKSPFPKPSPRTSLLQGETGKKPGSDSAKSPTPVRKARAKSPARDLSPDHSAPPPLPSSAPPSFPLSVPPSASPYPSPRHLPTGNHSQETTSQSTGLPKKTVDSASKSPRQTTSSVASLVLSSSSGKEPASSGSAGKDNLTAPSRPPPQLSVLNSKVKSSSCDSSGVSPRPAGATSVAGKSTPSVTMSGLSGVSLRPTTISTSLGSTSTMSSNISGFATKSTSPASTVSSSTFTSKSTISIQSNRRQEKPMDVDTAMNKARAQYGEEPVAVMVVPVDKDKQEKTALSGLLKSLAQVRSTSSTATTTTTSSASAASMSSGDKPSGKFSASNSNGATDKSQHKHATANSGPKSASSSGFVASKVGRLQTKDSGNKSSQDFVSSGKGKIDSVSPRDINSGHLGGKLAPSSHKSDNSNSSSDKSKDWQGKVSPGFMDDTKSTKLPDKKLNEPVTVTLNVGTKNKEESSQPKASVLSNLKLNNKPAKQNGNMEDYVPQWKKDLAENRAAEANKTGGLSVEPGRRDRARSAADVLSVKQPPSIAKATTPESLQPPPFTQVKLRESGNSTLDRKERSKSAGNVFENSAEVKSEWQLEAERRMAALRDTGFVDPEFKKSTSGSDSPVEDEDTGVNKGRKEEPVATVVPSKHIAGFHARGDGNLQAKLNEDLKEVTKAGKDSKPEIKIFKSTQPTAVEKDKEKEASKPERTGLNLKLRGILKSEENRHAPVKPERSALPEKQGDKVSPLASPHDSTAAQGKKKINVGNLSPTAPPRPSSPPKKRISVDMKFDFNSSNSVELPKTPEERPPPPKLTPPARPPPPRTSMSPGRISAIELQHQLLDIDSKLSDLELRGRQLEDSIRSVVAEEEDDLMVEWFQLVTEKNELVRKETDLVYMSREQDLEDEQSQIESQLHYLLSKDENDKSFEEKEEEDYLIQRKVEIVNQRNSIVDSMDEDRLRYEEEDRDIAQVLQEKGFRRDSNSSPEKTPAKGGKSKTKAGKVGSSMFYA